MKNSTRVKSRVVALVLALSLIFGMGMVATPAVMAASSSTSLNSTVGTPAIALSEPALTSAWPSRL